MKSITILFALLMLVGTTGCSGKKQKNNIDNQVTIMAPVQAQELKGYFVKNTYQPAADINPMLIKNQTEFDNLFGIGKTMANTITSPDFQSSWVIALVVRSTNMETEVKLSEYRITGKTLQVYFTVKMLSERSFTSVPLGLYTIDQQAGIDNIQFFVNGEKKQEVVVND